MLDAEDCVRSLIICRARALDSSPLISRMPFSYYLVLKKGTAKEKETRALLTGEPSKSKVHGVYGLKFLGFQRLGFLYQVVNGFAEVYRTGS